MSSQLCSQTFVQKASFSVLLTSNQQFNQLPFLSPIDQQIRFRRHDRSSVKPRKTTKKQRQAYNRKQSRLQKTVDKHSKPGFKAGPRREWAQDRWNQLLELGNNRSLLNTSHQEEYTMEDAIVEDLLGNTSHLSSQPTPEPLYLGDKHDQYFAQVSTHMDRYRASKEAHQNETSSLSFALPSDRQLSQVLRAYRDKNGTRQRPIGIVAALSHLLKDLGVPTSAIGELTYTTLLTCCRTEQEVGS